MHAQTMKIRQSREDRAFTAVIAVVVGLIMLLTIYPLYIVVISSFSAPMEVISGHVWLLPQGFSGEGYRRVFQNSDIFMSYKNTIIYTVLGTAVSLFFTLSAAYPLSRKKLYGRTGLMLLFTFTMFFKGGIIPTYLTVKGLGLYNNIWVMVLMGSLSIYNMIVARTFLQNTIPNEIYEATEMDGANDIQVFFQIVLPLSMPILAVLSLFYAVGIWNNYFTGLIYLKSRSLYPLQLVLREILVNDTSDMTDTLEANMNKLLVQESVKYCVIVVSSVPMLVLYPFLQRFFAKGVMIGAIKG
ncbi:MAG: carbohydrate ABC transporter permease [Eubacteriales bacterium]|nr:carbohydrate ABC transporter permease [Eubacteriales bacterium]